MPAAKPTQLPICQGFSPHPDDINKGSLMVNCFKDARPEGEYAIRRHGLFLFRDVSASGPVTNGLVTQQVPFTTTNMGFIIVGGAAPVAYASSGGGSLALAAGGTTYANDWMSYIDLQPLGSQQGWLAAQDAMWTVAGNGTNLISTFLAGTPTKLCPGLAFLDGTAYCMTAVGDAIRGSALQDITTWNGLNTVGASSSWGAAIGIRRHLNYILGFWENGLQVFYNAGLAPPASPLAPLPNASFLVGCTSGFTVVSLADTTIFVGKTAANNFSVYQLSGLSLTPISSPAVEFILKRNITALTQTSRQITNIYPQSMAYAIADKGHTFYVLKITDVITLAYDLGMKEWYVWEQTVGGVQVPYQGSFSGDNFVAGQDRILSVIGESIYTDYSGTILATIRTANMDFGSAYKKFVWKLSVYGDTIPGTMTMAYSDDDYATYSTGVDNIDLSKQRKMVNRCGSFYERSFRFRYSGNQPFRLKYFEMLLEGGSS
jgi:hypothetical protein